MSKITVIKVEPGKEAYVDFIEDSYDAFSDYVGGYIEYVRLDDDTLLICNEEGKLIGLKPNRYIYGGADVVCGNFLIVGDDHEGGECSLNDSQIHTYLEHFKTPPVKVNPDDVRLDFRFYSF